MEYIDFDFENDPENKLKELRELFPCIDWHISYYEHDLGDYYGLSVPDSQYELAQEIIDKYSDGEITCIDDFKKTISIFYKGDAKKLIFKLKELRPDIEWALNPFSHFIKDENINLKKVEIPYNQFEEAERFLNNIENELN